MSVIEKKKIPSLKIISWGSSLMIKKRRRVMWCNVCIRYIKRAGDKIEKNEMGWACSAYG